MIQIYLGLIRRLDRMRWVPQLLARLSVGVMFCGSGFNKLTSLGDLVAYFKSLGIPLASLQAPMTAGIEFAGGSLLLLGLATRPVAAMLSGVMTVAILTARLQEAHIEGLIDFLYLNEWLLLLILIWFVFAGAGKVSLDRVVAGRVGAARPEPAGASTAAN